MATAFEDWETVLKTDYCSKHYFIEHVSVNTPTPQTVTPLSTKLECESLIKEKNVPLVRYTTVQKFEAIPRISMK